MDQVWIVKLDAEIVGVCASREAADIVWGDMSVTLPDDRWVDDDNGMPTVPSMQITRHEVIVDA